MDIFELSEVAEVLGIPKTKVANWTIGRPLKITPSVRTALGKGARNLYGRHSLYLMAIANALIEAGLNSGAVQKVLDAINEELLAQGGHDERRDEMGPEPTLEGDIPRLKIIVGGDKDAEYFEETDEGHIFRLKGTFSNIEVTYDINIKALVEGINRRVLQLQTEAPYLPDDTYADGPSRKSRTGRKPKQVGQSKQTKQSKQSKQTKQNKQPTPGKPKAR